MHCYLPYFNIGCIVVIWYNTATECDAGIELYCKCGALPSHLGRLERRTRPPVLTGGLPERKDWRFVAGKGFPWISADLGLQLFFRRRISARFDSGEAVVAGTFSSFGCYSVGKLILGFGGPGGPGGPGRSPAKWTMGPAAAQTEDVSNPLKPFDLSKTWAMRVLDEFFQQGESWQILAVGKKDEEKGSQHESASLARQLVHLRMKRNSRAFQLAC